MKHIGTVGERLALTLTCTGHFTLPPTRFGYSDKPSQLVFFTDELGNEFVWKTGARAPERGTTRAYKATVKGHSEYSGRPQTKLLRVTPL